MFPAVVKDKILLVDDQVETRKLLRLALRDLDFTVVEASEIGRASCRERV